MPVEQEEVWKGYILRQLDSGHWYAIAPNGDECNIHWSKVAVKNWVRDHRRPDTTAKEKSE